MRIQSKPNPAIDPDRYHPDCHDVSMPHKKSKTQSDDATRVSVTKEIYPAAFGDLLAAVLALVALWAVVKNWRSARFLVCVFALEGTIDLIKAITLAQLHGAAAFMGAAYWIPAFWVPALLVTLYITFVVLIKHWKDADEGLEHV